MSPEKIQKERVFNNVLVPIPRHSGRIITKLRENQELLQKDLNSRMRMRGRSAISEYETESSAISSQAWSLLAIALNFHPNLPDGTTYSGQLVFETNPEPSDSYPEFITKALDKENISINELAKRARLSSKDITSILKGDTTPKAKQWASIQLALNTFASGVNAGEIMKEERIKRNWDQADIAEVVGISSQSISNYETSKTIPGNHVWALVMLAYDIHPNYTLLKQDAPEDIISYLNEKNLLK